MKKEMIAKHLLSIAKELIAEQIIDKKKLDNEILIKLKRNFNKVQQTRYSNDFWFDYKNNECCLSYYNNKFKGFGYNFNVDMNDGKHIHKQFVIKDLDKIIKEIKEIIDSYSYDKNTKQIKNKIEKIFDGWRFDRLEKSNDTLIVYLSKKAYGDGYNAYCIVNNGRIIETDNNHLIKDETEKLLKQIDVKNIKIYGVAD